MSADWIKMRTDLYRDPKVCIVADALMDPSGELAEYVNQNCRCDMTVTRNVTRNVTVGALVTLWGVTRHRGKRDGDDLVIRNATLSVVDDIVDLPGFGKALSTVGWVAETDEGIVFPRFFEEYNADPHENAKEKNTERQRRYREKRNALRNVTVTSLCRAREEKNREEKSIKTEAQDAIASHPPAEEKKQRVRKVFATPTVDEVAEYVAEIGSPVDPQYFVDYYKSNGWIVGASGAAMKDWKATVRNWTKREGKGNPYDRKLSGFNTAQSREQRNADAFAIVEAAIASSSSEDPAGYLAGPQASLFHEEAGELHTLRH